MPDSPLAQSVPRRPGKHSHYPSLPIADEFCSSQWSSLLTPHAATDFDYQSSFDPDDSSSVLHPCPYTDTDDTSTQTLLRSRSHSSYEPVHDVANHEGHAELDISTEHDDAYGLQNDQESSYRLSTLKQPPETGTSKQVLRTELWKSRPSALSQYRFAVDDGGWWWHQMLVDRSLRFMAALTTLFALMMVILCIVYFGDFVHRVNANSTSVGGISGESCSTMESRNIALHLFLNIAATITLGMSNTFQTIVSSLKADELRWALSKYGDARIGTNSPFNINRKKTGKASSWCAWLLLVSTSFPIHFLINSVFGPSFYVTPPTHVIYNPIPSMNYSTRTTAMMQYSSFQLDTSDISCWSAFRAGVYTYPSDMDYMAAGVVSIDPYSTLSRSSVTVTYYDANCTKYRNTTRDLLSLYDEMSPGYQFFVGDCWNAKMVACELGGNNTQSCRLNIRMSAALTLAGCLVLKAGYMIFLNFRARRKVKTRCLTYGDVIVASVLDPRLRIWNECLVNAQEGHRHKVSHTCHKHCSDSEPSKTGDNIGHCQKCKMFNTIDKAADLIHPVIAIKYKSSLISNLGVTAVSQMMMLTLCSLTMVGVSILLAIVFAGAAITRNDACPKFPNNPMCEIPLGTYLNDKFGGFGGFNTSVSLAALAPDNLGSEFLAFSIANGAQFLYSLLYLLLIYNVTLISMEHDWGTLEKRRQKLRCTIVKGGGFAQSYLLQLPKRVLFPAMGFSALMHWLLGQAISTIEITWADPVAKTAHTQNFVVYAVYPIWLSTVLMLVMTSVCWWAFTYRREGFIPQLYGSVRACCSATTELDSFGKEGVMWGDLTKPDPQDTRFRHAGLSSGTVEQIVPGELYCGRDSPHLKVS